MVAELEGIRVRVVQVPTKSGPVVQCRMVESIDGKPELRHPYNPTGCPALMVGLMQKYEIGVMYDAVIGKWCAVRGDMADFGDAHKTPMEAVAFKVSAMLPTRLPSTA